MIAFFPTSKSMIESMMKRGTTKPHLYQKRAGYLSRITNDFEHASGPKPPFDAVIHSPHKTCFLPSCVISPFLFPSFPVSLNRPPQGFKTGLNFAIRQFFIALVGNFHPSCERFRYFVGYISCPSFGLKFIEIGRFEWPGITKTEKGGYPAESN